MGYFFVSEAQSRAGSVTLDAVSILQALCSGTARLGGDDVDVDTRFDEWLDLIAEMLLSPVPEFPRHELTRHFVDSFQTRVSWHWVRADGPFGVDHMSHPIPDWPSPSDVEAWRVGMTVHPLTCWVHRVGDLGAMSVGRVPRALVPPEGFAHLREHLGPVGLDEQLSVPYEVVDGTLRTVVLSQTGEDYCDEDFDLARRIQPLVQVLARQRRIIQEAGSTSNRYSLTGRELAVLHLLRTGRTAGAIGRHLDISRRTVEKHLENTYRKMGVRDRMAAVRLADAHAEAWAVGARPPFAVERARPAPTVETDQDAGPLVFPGRIPHPAANRRSRVTRS